MILRIVMVACIFVVIGILTSEIRSWRAGTRIITPFQKALRIASASLMIMILSMVLAGDRWVYPYGSLAVMGYWMICFSLAIILLVIALLDIREVGISYGEERRRMLRRLIQRGDEDDDT